MTASGPRHFTSQVMVAGKSGRACRYRDRAKGGFSLSVGTAIVFTQRGLPTPPTPSPSSPPASSQPLFAASRTRNGLTQWVAQLTCLMQGTCKRKTWRRDARSARSLVPDERLPCPHWPNGGTTTETDGLRWLGLLDHYVDWTEL
ncbi:hypothetical protein HPB50_000738 [Hyalomma asiaticum]|uniref:Uncharacterized protein n=1 Tax=Hyalomma asiaticum TaxID=266040 RepID=A0ACB7SU47_HYAAI|nr:hypothetical protein HPB50_000738 [Hyalomma asiaticum]